MITLPMNCEIKYSTTSASPYTWQMKFGEQVVAVSFASLDELLIFMEWRDQEDETISIRDYFKRKIPPNDVLYPDDEITMDEEE